MQLVAKQRIMICCAFAFPAMILLFVLIQPGPYLGVKAQRKRINEYIRQLRLERDDELAKNMYVHTEMFSYPRYVTGRKFDQGNLEDVFANRRCVKYLNHVEALPESSRKQRLADDFELVFNVHQSAICNFIELDLKPDIDLRAT